MRAPEGFDAFVAAAGHRLHATAFLLTRDHGLAEDLVQTALARSWRAWRRVEGDSPGCRRSSVPWWSCATSRTCPSGRWRVMDLDELRQELRAAADDGRVPHAERMAGVRRRVRRGRAARVVPVAVVLVAAAREAGVDLEVGQVERTATSLSPGAPPCGPSYSVFLSGDDGVVQLLLTVSWAGDDRFSGNLTRPGGAPVEACADRSEEGWSGTVQTSPGGQLVVLARTDGPADGDRGPTTPAVAVRQLQGDPIVADGLVSVALAQDWHRLAEQVEAEVGP